VYDVAIIGCGLVGCYLAGKLAEKGFNVLAIEEHRQIGYPSKCTGLVSWRIKQLLPGLPESIIQNEVSSAEFFSPTGFRFTLSSKKPMYVVDRPKLDRWLYEKALQASMKTGERFVSFKAGKECVEINTSKDSYKAELLIGCDGAFSAVARSAKLEQPSNVVYALQATVDGSFDAEKVELWFGSKVAPQFFAWVVPISENRAKVGLATKEKPREYFKSFVRMRCKRFVEPDTAGAIRFGLMKKTVDDRLLLVGDAASQVKPFSGGGIIYGLIAANTAYAAVVKAFARNDFSESFFAENYEKVWKERLAPGIRKGLLLRKILYLDGDRWIDCLFRLAARARKLIENWDVDLL